MKACLTRIALAIITLTPCLAFADDFKPRAEVNFKAGTERSILTTEFWAPLAQQNDRIIYGDLRLMGDDGDNREGNLGFGYRQIYSKTNSVLGGNIWIDRRRTENGNYFHQLTLGVESLGDKVDVRANGYIQLNNSKTTITPNIGSANPYLSGTGIFYDTNGFIVEEPQDGFDAEIGYRLPVLQKQIDATRVYAGGYHFWGNTTDNVTGFRLRTEAQINSIFSIGARFQHDSPRGSQGFLEATLRFPFKSKKLFQEHGLRSRLDESPERDIDIVTGKKVDTGLMKPVVNVSGTAQRILYVDNTNTNTGDGSKDNPFNTLLAAEAALQENDILYINRGDGTSAGMDQGITINKANIQLIGSGSALTYSGFTLLNAALAPVFTSTTGNGITGSGGGDLSISGVRIQDTFLQGISIIAQNGVSFRNITIANTQTANNGVTSAFNSAIEVRAFEGHSIDSVLIENNQVSNITGGGARAVYVQAQDQGNAASQIKNITVKNNTFTNNQINLAVNLNGSNSSFSNVLIEGNDFSNSVGTSLTVNAVSGQIDTVSLNSNTFTSNNRGISVRTSGASSYISNVIIDNNFTTNSVGEGIFVNAGDSAKINSILASNNTSNNNTNSSSGKGININATNNGNIVDIQLLNNTTNFNRNAGVYILADSAVINNASIIGSISNSNGSQGIYVLSQNSGSIGNVVTDNAKTANNGQYGIIYYTLSSSTIGSASLINSSSNDNVNDNIRIESTSGNTIGQLTLTNVVANNSQSSRGVLVYANGGTINNAVLTNVTANNNRVHGLWVYSNGTGIINSASLSGITANNNTSNGIYFQTSAATSVLNNVTLSNSTATGNGTNGIYVQRAVTSAILNANLGGVSGSVGQNRVFGNGSVDLRIDGGLAVNALYNWWGNPAGLQTSRRTLNGGSTVDASSFLTTDPRP